MPPLGQMVGRSEFQRPGRASWAPTPDGTDVLVKYGAFLQSAFDFLIIAFVLFMALKGINKLKKPPRRCPTAAPPPPPRNEVLLEEIRDLLKK